MESFAWGMLPAEEISGAFWQPEAMQDRKAVMVIVFHKNFFMAAFKLYFCCRLTIQCQSWKKGELAKLAY